jgi:hypothetical protein
MDREQLKKSLAEVAKTAGTLSDRQLSAFAELIVETINPNHITLEVFNAFMPTRQLNVGDQLVKRVARTGFPVRTMVPGTTHLSDPFYPPQLVVNYALDRIIAKMRMNLWELRRGELGTLDDFRSQMESAMIDELVARVYTLLSTIWDGAHSRTNYYDATSTGLTTTILDNMVETVLYRAGSVRAIVGSRAALLPIYKMGGIVEITPTVNTNTNGVIGLQEILLEWRRTGRLAQFRGIPLIEIPQIFRRTTDHYDQPLVDMTRVLVIGDNAGEVVLYGGTETQESTDLTTEPGDYVLAMWRQYGMIVDQVENIGVIKVADAPNVPYSVSWPISGQ